MSGLEKLLVKMKSQFQQILQDIEDVMGTEYPPRRAIGMGPAYAVCAADRKAVLGVTMPTPFGAQKIASCIYIRQ